MLDSFRTKLFDWKKGNFSAKIFFFFFFRLDEILVTLKKKKAILRNSWSDNTAKNHTQDIKVVFLQVS